PKWDTCSANICPLDPDWHKRTHLAGERVCFWLTERAKDGGHARVAVRLAPVRGACAGELNEAIAEAEPNILARQSHIKKVVRAASRTGSKLANSQRLQRGAS